MVIFEKSEYKTVNVVYSSVKQQQHHHQKKKFKVTYIFSTCYAMTRAPYVCIERGNMPKYENILVMWFYVVFLFHKYSFWDMACFIMNTKYICIFNIQQLWVGFFFFFLIFWSKFRKFPKDESQVSVCHCPWWAGGVGGGGAVMWHYFRVLFGPPRVAMGPPGPTTYWEGCWHLPSPSPSRVCMFSSWQSGQLFLLKMALLRYALLKER